MKVKSKQLKKLIKQFTQSEAVSSKEAQAIVADFYLVHHSESHTSDDKKHPKCSCLSICDAQDCSDVMREVQKAIEGDETHESTPKL